MSEPIDEQAVLDAEVEPAEDAAEDIERELPFCYFHFFTYSQRPGTPATKLPDQVPVAVAR